MTIRPVVGIAVLSLILTGYFAKVEQLPSLKKPPVFAPLPESDPDMLIGLTISGGGSLAATFVAGVLEALAELKVNDGARERSLIDRVQYISSVSGGSLAAAYYAAMKPTRTEPVLDGQDLSPAYRKFFRDYKHAMQKNFEWPVLF